MVIVMGMSFSLGGRDNRYRDYIVKRFRRLILPVWIFLIIYFLIATVLRNVLPVFDFNIEDLFYSFILQTGIPEYGGIGYVWIFRVYFFMALISPVLKAVSEKCTSKSYTSKSYILILIGLVLINEIVGLLCQTVCAVPIGEVFSQVVPYLTGYAVALFIGIVVDKMSKGQRIIITLLFGSVFVAHMLVFGFELTQTQKYPPRLYYLSYAVMASMVCYACANIKRLQPIVRSKIIMWLSQNSFWLYLWHIIPLKVITSSILPDKLDNFVVRYVCIVACTVILVEIHSLIKIVWKVIRRQKL